MRVDTSTYEWNHGKMPRGYGQWVFSLGLHSEKIVCFSGKYGEAKKKAIQSARKLGLMYVTVEA